MVKKFSFNIPLYTKAVTDRLVGTVIETNNELYLEILKNSPVDTGTYIKQNRNEGVRRERNYIIGRIVNEGDYPERVEGGWHNYAVHWHLRSGEVYFDVGAMPFEKSIKRIEKNFYKNLQQKLGL